MTGVFSVAVLWLLGAIPAVLITGVSRRAFFLAPVVGALEAAIAAMLLFVLPGSFGVWLAIVGLAANLTALFIWKRGARIVYRWPSSPSSTVEFCVVLVSLTWPLLALTAPIIGYDAEAIWLLHSAMVYGGHDVLHNSLTNPGAATNNPDYPPLIPGAVALTYIVRGAVQQFQGLWAITLLNCASLGLIACGLLDLVRPALGRGAQVGRIALVGGYCAGAMSVAGIYAVNGYADLLWASLAVCAVVYGVMLPWTKENVAVAMVAINSAALTKNEGLSIGVFVALMIGCRYLRRGPVSIPRIVRSGLITTACLAGGLAWYVVVNGAGIHDAFFGGSSGEGVAYRLRVTMDGAWHNLHLVPVAFCVAAIGVAVCGSDRTLLRRSAALWAAAGWAFVVIVLTYVFGALEIHWWMFTSVTRTMIFVNLCLITDMVLWAMSSVTALEGSHLGAHYRSASVPSC
jgi:hypothetical protein